MKVAKNSKGFTLVELLVVLAIIGVLIGLAIGGIRIVQQVNRDTQRRAFLSKDIQLLLEAHLDRKNKYPKYLAFDDSSSECADGELLIETKENGAGDSTIEKICSKVNFDITAGIGSGECDDFTDKENESGDLTMCFDGESKGYKLMVKLERSEEPYNASNTED